MTDIRTARKRVGLTQAELAQEAGVTAATIGNLEHGRCTPRMCNLERIMMVLKSKLIGFITNGDILRRQIISDAELVSNGRVRCAGDRTACSRNCYECKIVHLQAPYQNNGPK